MEIVLLSTFIKTCFSKIFEHPLKVKQTNKNNLFRCVLHFFSENIQSAILYNNPNFDKVTALDVMKILY